MKTNLLCALAALVVLATGLSLATAIEWIDVEVHTPARGEAARNERYVAKSLLEKLGASVVQHKSTGTLPPVSVPLVLYAWDWDGFPDRTRRLKAWVEQGGQLAIPAASLDSESLATWLPVGNATPKASGDDEPEDAPAAEPAARVNPVNPVKSDPDRHCRTVTAPGAQPGAYSDGRGFRLCTARGGYYQPQGKAVASWSVAGDNGIELLRVPLGRGSVTVFDDDLLDNDILLRGDHALLMVAALQAHPGAEIWFLTDEGREPFLLWLWRNGWAAIVPGTLALLLIWWRAAVRFGPYAAIPALSRRSMREQVRGTAAFLRQRGPAALHAAQRRALDECVAQRIRLPLAWDDARRASAIAEVTGIDVKALARALPLNPVRPRVGAALALDLQVLESARRRLLAGSSAAASPSSASPLLLPPSDS